MKTQRNCYTWVYLCQVWWRVRSYGQIGRDEEYEFKCSQRGEAQQGPVVQTPPCVPLSSERRLCLSSGCRKGTLIQRSVDLLQGKVLSAHDILNDMTYFYSLRYSMCQGTIIWGSMSWITAIEIFIAYIEYLYILSPLIFSPGQGKNVYPCFIWGGNGSSNKWSDGTCLYTHTAGTYRLGVHPQDGPASLSCASSGISALWHARNRVANW